MRLSPLRRGLATLCLWFLPLSAWGQDQTPCEYRILLESYEVGASLAVETQPELMFGFDWGQGLRTLDFTAANLMDGTTAVVMRELGRYRVPCEGSDTLDVAITVRELDGVDDGIATSTRLGETICLNVDQETCPLDQDWPAMTILAEGESCDESCYSMVIGNHVYDPIEGAEFWNTCVLSQLNGDCLWCAEGDAQLSFPLTCLAGATPAWSQEVTVDVNDPTLGVWRHQVTLELLIEPVTDAMYPSCTPHSLPGGTTLSCLFDAAVTTLDHASSPGLDGMRDFQVTAQGTDDSCGGELCSGRAGAVDGLPVGQEAFMPLGLPIDNVQCGESVTLDLTAQVAKTDGSGSQGDVAVSHELTCPPEDLNGSQATHVVSLQTDDGTHDGDVSLDLGHRLADTNYCVPYKERCSFTVEVTDLTHDWALIVDRNGFFNGRTWVGADTSVLRAWDLAVGWNEPDPHMGSHLWMLAEGQSADIVLGGEVTERDTLIVARDDHGFFLHTQPMTCPPSAWVTSAVVPVDLLDRWGNTAHSVGLTVDVTWNNPW